MSNIFKFCPTHFFQGGQNFSMEVFASPAPYLATGLAALITVNG